MPVDPTDLERVTFRRVAERGEGARFWDFVAPDGATVFARAEVFPGTVQWGVRLQDRAPALEDRDLLRLVARLLVWEIACPAETVEVVLGRTHDRHALVKVAGDYV
jgi:hypothetical protein